MANHRKRKDHRPAILRALVKRGPLHFSQIISSLRGDDAYRQIDYDIKTLRAAGCIRTEGGRWHITPAGVAVNAEGVVTKQSKKGAN